MEFQMTHLLCRLIAETHAERVLLGIHAALTIVVFVFLGMLTLAN
jgi:hypothetical protein